MAKVILLHVYLFVFVGCATAIPDGSTVFCVNNTFLYINNTKEWLTGSQNLHTKIAKIGHQDSYLQSTSFLFRANYLIFSDRGTKTIFLYTDKPAEIGVYAHVGVSEGIGELAVDWLNYNVYWCDSIFSWIGLQALPRAISKIANNDKQRIVIEKSLKKPYGLAVAPQQRYLFWTDYGNPPRIERSSLSGEGRKTLIWTGIKTPLSITVDPSTSQLFWLDIARASIERCDFEGQGRRLLLQRFGYSLSSLTVFDDHVIYTEVEKNDIHVVSKVTGVQSALSLDLDGEPKGLSVFSESMQQFNNSECDNYGCSHICVQYAAGPKCLCDGGFELLANRKTCNASTTEAIWKSIIYTNGSIIQAFPVTTLNSQRYVRIEVTTLTSGENINHLAPDSKTRSLYFTSGNMIKKLVIGGGVFSMTTAAEEITGLVFDTFDEKLIFTVSGAGRIQTSALTTNSSSVDLYTDLRSPADLAIDVRNRKLFWISSASPSRIVTGGVAGGSVSVLVASNLAQPTRLTFDIHRNRLYWTEDGKMGSVLADGSGRITQPLTPLPTYIGVAVFKDYLLWTGSLANKVNMSASVIVDNGYIKTPTVFTMPDITTVTDIVIYDTDGYITDSGGCENNNGGCHHVCLPGDNENTCGCNFGFRLLEDGQNCRSDVVDKDFTLVIDDVHNSIYQLDESNKVHGVDVLPANTPSIVRYDWLKRQVVWFDQVRHLINRATLNGSGERVVIGTEKMNVHGLDIDPSTSNIYYSVKNKTGGYIKVVSYDGLIRRTLLNMAGEPGPLAIHPKTGTLVWGENNTVKMATMAGTGISTLMSIGLSAVSDIAIDTNGETLYIADSPGDQIRSFQLRTRTEKVLRQSTKDYPRVLAVKGDNLYYLSVAGRNIRAINKDTSEEISSGSEVEIFGHLSSLFVYRDAKGMVNEQCSISNGECSSFCLPTTQGGRVCACADGASLNDDNRFCNGDSKCPTQIQNGQLADGCLPHQNNICGFTCENGYENTISTLISCQTNGQWNVSLDTVCISKDSKCPTQIQNGQLADGCLPHQNNICGFTCENGYENTISTLISCQTSGQWNVSLDTVCVSKGINQTGLIVGVIVGVIVVIVIVMVVICLKRRRKNRRSDKTNFYDKPVIKEEEVYDEIDEPKGHQSHHYIPFTRISPNPPRKGIVSGVEINNPAYRDSPPSFPNSHLRHSETFRSESPIPDYEQPVSDYIHPISGPNPYIDVLR